MPNERAVVCPAYGLHPLATNRHCHPGEGLRMTPRLGARRPHSRCGTSRD